MPRGEKKRDGAKKNHEVILLMLIQWLKTCRTAKNNAEALLDARMLNWWYI
jgi:hypothetical protein